MMDLVCGQLRIPHIHKLPVRVDGVHTPATSSMSRLVSSGGSPMRARNGAK